jgi:hypothetical protein
VAWGVARITPYYTSARAEGVPARSMTSIIIKKQASLRPMVFSSVKEDDWTTKKGTSSGYPPRTSGSKTNFPMRLARLLHNLVVHLANFCSGELKKAHFMNNVNQFLQENKFILGH